MKDFKEILLILLRFLGIWLLFFIVYQVFLNQYKADIDPITRFISDQSAFLLNSTGFVTQTKDFPFHETIMFYINDKPATRMVEGCNAVSVMIMFLAFIFAFYKGVKTFLFVFGGLILLHILNVCRIALLNIIYLKYPQYEKMSHDYLFPAIIYGGVIILWLIWIQFFALKKVKNA